MVTGYFKIAIRNVFRRPIYNGINILGLSLGITAAAITVLYGYHELNYDNFHNKADRTYRISGKSSETWFATLPPSYSDALYLQNFPEVEAITRVRRWPPKFIRYANDKFYAQKVLFTDPGSDFFTIFNFQFIQGNAAEALKNPNAVVLTSSIAKNIFKNEDAIGKEIVYDTLHLIVTGVIKDLPSNTNFNFTLLISSARAMKEASSLFTYCILSKNVDITALKAKLLSLPKPVNAFSVLQDVDLIPLRELHFKESMTFEMKPPGSKLYLFLFILIGIMIMALSCINYMNLSIAIYAGRRKEIAVRKVAGAGNVGLAIQFMAEAVCLCLVCLPLTVVFIKLILPWFNQFMEVQLRNEFIFSLPGLGILLGITLLVGIISGSYPAWVLPKLKTTILFRKINITGKGGLNLRQVLVTFQIAVFAIILSSGWIINRQLNYMQQKDLGFDKDAVLKLTGAWRVDSLQYYSLKNELLKSHFVKSVSQGFTPGDEDYGLSYKADDATEIYNDLISFNTDKDYLKTLDIKLLYADFNNTGAKSPERYIVINETLARRLRYHEPLGKTIILSPGTKNEKAYIINGVIKDFNFFSLRQSVAPMLLRIRAFGGGINENILVKIQTQHLVETMDFIHQKAEQFIPDIPMTTEFLDESLIRLYKQEQKLSTLTGVLMLITLFLAIIGLVGLASYMAELRTKEIGVRKVLGATVVTIMGMLLKDFLKLVLKALIIAAPIAYYASHIWLQNFVYKIHIQWWVFAVTGVITLFIAFITIGFQAIKAALMNPVKSLRTE